MKTTLQILTEARELIKNDYGDPLDDCGCALCAIQKVIDGPATDTEAYNVLIAAMPYARIPAASLYEYTSSIDKEEHLALFDRAIEAERGKENNNE